MTITRPSDGCDRPPPAVTRLRGGAGRSGPGRPLGSKNHRPATRYDVGKTVRRPESITERDRARP